MDLIMNNKSHNDKPWKQGNPDFGIIYADNGNGNFDTVVAITEMHEEDTDENAKRIVACVNACIGISNEELAEIASEGGMLTTRQQIANMATKLDDLLASLKNVLDYVDKPPLRNCRCHINPPCSDCVEWSHLREIIEIAYTSTAKAEA